MEFFNGVFRGTLNDGEIKNMLLEALESALKSGKLITVVISDDEEQRKDRSEVKIFCRHLGCPERGKKSLCHTGDCIYCGFYPERPPKESTGRSLIN